jgi:acetolactate synthase-1/2/3 large subunit
MKIGGGEMLAKMLERETVEYVFGLHGGQIDPIFQACFDRDIRIIDTRHEQAAGHMAGAWARTTRRPGVAIVTAVANAYMDSSDFRVPDLANQIP